MKPKYKCLLLDFDGTLVDTSLDVAHTLNLTRSEIGKSDLPTEFILKLLRKGFEEMIMRGLEISLPELDRYIDLFNDIYSNKEKEILEFHPGAEHFLAVDKHPKIILSNKPTHLIKRALKTLMCPYVFLDIIGPDTFGFRKPDVRLMERVTEKHGFSAEDCLMVGDDTPDIQFSRAIPLDFVFCNFGFRKGEFKGKFKSINTYDELPRYLYDFTY